MYKPEQERERKIGGDRWVFFDVKVGIGVYNHFWKSLKLASQLKKVIFLSNFIDNLKPDTYDQNKLVGDCTTFISITQAGSWLSTISKQKLMA